MLRAYPSVGDLGLYFCVVLLLGSQLHYFKIGLFLGNSFLLISVLGPAMWHQWIDAESANSNFYYSITLLLGAWHVVFLVQILSSALKLEESFNNKA
jgi:phosphatidylinositol glycan class U